MILYHYTSKAAYNEITKPGGGLRPTGPWTVDDSALGHGWYFTDWPPEKCYQWTLAYCWKNLDLDEKVQCYLKWQIPDDILVRGSVRGREHVFMVPQNHARAGEMRYLGGGGVPSCRLRVFGSCAACNVLVSVKNFLVGT